LARPRLSLRSQLSILLLLLLREAPAPSHYISYYLVEDSDKVARYLRRLREYGLAARDEYGIWFLTEKGREYIERYLESMALLMKAAQNIKEYIELFRDRTKTGQKPDRNRTKTGQKPDKNRTETSLRTILEKAEQLLGRKLSRTEKALITYLHDFTRKTGRKYWWPPEPVPLPLALSEELRSSSSNSSSSIDATPTNISTILRELEARGIIYIVHDKHRNTAKIRLSRTLLEQ